MKSMKLDPSARRQASKSPDRGHPQPTQPDPLPPQPMQSVIGKIVQDHLLTFLNGVFGAIALVLVALGYWGEAIAIAAIIGFYVAVHGMHTLKAQRQLRRLTWRSHSDDQGRSSSHAVADDAWAVGAAEQPSPSPASEAQLQVTPLQREFDGLIRLLLAIAIGFGLLNGASLLIGITPLDAATQEAVVIAGWVPSGLYLMLTLAQALGLLRLDRRPVWLKHLNSAAALGQADVFCLDPSSLLASPRLSLQSVQPIGLSMQECRMLLGDYAASLSSRDRPLDAIATACFGQPRPRRSEVLATSTSGWSAIAFDDPEHADVYVLGTPAQLLPQLAPEVDLALLQADLEQASQPLLLAHAAIHELYSAEGQPVLPDDLVPICLLSFGAALHPQMQVSLTQLSQAGMQVKLLSSDRPAAVTAIAQQLWLPDAPLESLPLVTGPELAQMGPAQFAHTALAVNLFAQLTLDQKAQLVQAWQRQGHAVAMMGDDASLPALRQADVKIALASSKATPAIADIILPQDGIEHLGHLVQVGQQMYNGTVAATKLFVVRVGTMIALSLGIGLITFTLPLTLRLNTLVAFLAVGLPAIALVLSAPSGRSHQRSLLPAVLRFALPAILLLSGVGLLVYWGFLVAAVTPVPELLQGQVKLADLTQAIAPEQIAEAIATAQSALATLLILGGLLLVPFLRPPTAAWVGAEPLQGTWRNTLIALALLGVYGLILAVPALRQFWGLQVLSPVGYLSIGLAALFWSLGLRFLWRHRLIERYLGLSTKIFR